VLFFENILDGVELFEEVIIGEDVGDDNGETFGERFGEEAEGRKEDNGETLGEFSGEDANVKTSEELGNGEGNEETCIDETDGVEIGEISEEFTDGFSSSIDGYSSLTLSVETSFETSSQMNISSTFLFLSSSLPFFRLFSVSSHIVGNALSSQRSIFSS
jgi:hypothetical protein